MHIDRAEDVLTHKRLLEEAKVNENKAAFHLRAVQVSQSLIYIEISNSSDLYLQLLIWDHHTSVAIFVALKIFMSLFLVLQIFNAEPQDELMPQAATIDAIDDLKYVFYF